MTKDSMGYLPSPHLLAFIDALGFFKKIDSEESMSSTEKFFEQIDIITEFLKHRAENFGSVVKMTTIGDSIVLAIEAPSKKSRSTFSNLIFDEFFSDLCEAVGIFQAALAGLDIWTRGAITYGDLHFTASRIVGPAFHRAVFLEQNIARFPRVILDGEVIRASGCETCSELIEKSQTEHLLYQLNGRRPAAVELIRDVPSFIDFASLSGNITTEKMQWLTDVSRLVAQNLIKDANHFNKYRWLADYLLNYMALQKFDTSHSDDLNEIRRLLWQ